jgi:hypothetical protein
MCVVNAKFVVQLKSFIPEPDNEYGKFFQKAFQFTGKLDFIFLS